MSTKEDLLLSEISVLYEIAWLGFCESEEKLLNEALEKAVRLFGIRCFAVAMGPRERPSPLKLWGVKDLKEARLRLAGPNGFSFSLEREGNFVLILMERGVPIGERERQILNYFSRILANRLFALRAEAQKKEAEERIQRQLNMLMALYEGSRKLMERLDEETVANHFVQMCVEYLGVSLAWFGKAEPDGQVEVLAQYPPDHPYPRRIRVRWDETPEGQGPTGRAIRGGAPVIIDDILSDPVFVPWRSTAEAFGFRSSAAFPVIVQGRPYGALNLYSESPGFFGSEWLRTFSALSNQASAALENAFLLSEANKRLKRLQALHDIDLAITSNLDPRVTLKVLLNEVSVQLEVDATCVFSYDQGSTTLTYSLGRGFRGNRIEVLRFKPGEGVVGEAALGRHPVMVRDTRSCKDLTEDERALLEEENFISYGALPMVAKGGLLGVLGIFHRSPLDFDKEWVNFLESLAMLASIAVDNARLFSNLERANTELRIAYDATIEGWARALELRDLETKGHSQRVTDLTVELARRLGIGEEEIIHVRRGALLHDVGKMAIPDSILLKPAKLTPQEWEIMKKHPEYAYQMLYPISYLRPALDIPYCHHERWDGKGYPRGLKGEEIPLAARIFAVVDAWDAMTHDRPYRPALSRERALEEIKRGSGTQFDPKIVEVFLEFLKEKGFEL